MAVARVDVRMLSLLASDVEIIPEQGCSIGSIGAVPRGLRARNRFTPKMMADFRSGSANVIGRIPGAKLRTVKSHAAGRDVKEGCHDNAGIRHAIDPFALRQPIDT